MSTLIYRLKKYLKGNKRVTTLPTGVVCTEKNGVITVKTN